MSVENDHTVKSPWKLEITETGIHRIRNTSKKDGIPTLPLETKLRTMFMFGAGLAEMLGDEFSANVVEAKAEELAYGWAAVAQENERVRIVLNFLLETSAWSEALAPTVIVGGAVAWHYKLLPDNVGVPIAKISGAVPLSREQEIEMRRRAEAMAASEAADASAASPGEAEPSEAVPGSPTVVPIPPDADLGES